MWAQVARLYCGPGGQAVAVGPGGQQAVVVGPGGLAGIQAGPKWADLDWVGRGRSCLWTDLGGVGEGSPGRLCYCERLR